MSALPEWIKKLQKEDAEAQLMEEVPSGALAYEALAIAWEALEQTNIEIAHNGNNNHKTGRPTVFSVQDRMVEAMRHIEELGKE